MSKELELERLEKTSTLVRNIVLIIGALATAAIFLSERLSSDITVHANTFYLGGENTIISTPLGAVTELKGRLGTLTEAIITNNSDLPVALEVRIPKSEREKSNNDWPFFTTISADPLCHLRKNELNISNGGVITTNNVGSVEISKFPPGCRLDLTIASTLIDSNTRFMNGRIEVFYDGKKAEVEHPTKLYGIFGDYIYIVQNNGFLGFLLLTLTPIITILFSLVWLMENLPKSRNTKETKDEAETAA